MINLLLVLSVVVLGSALVLIFSPSSSDIPPTPAFMLINGTGGQVIAQTYNSFATLVEGSGMTILFDDETKEITFSSSGSGETNTASSVGDLDIFKQKTGVDLEFRGLQAGGGVTLLQKANNILINASSGSGETNTASNVGTGIGVFDQKNGVDLEFNSLIAGTGIDISDTTQDLTISTTLVTPSSITCGGTDKVSAYNSGTGSFTCSTDEQGSGGITSLSSPISCSSVSPNYCTIFTIPLTASGGNVISVRLSGDSNTAGVAIQPTARLDNAGSTGFCIFRHVTTATAEVIDHLSVSTTTADTGELTWLPGADIPNIITIECGIEADSTPGNLLIQIQMETTGTGTIQRGSYYIKTP